MSLRDRLCGLVVRVPDYRFRRPRFDSRRYQIFWEVVALEWGPLSLMSTTEELLGKNSSNSGLENWEYSCGDLLRWPRDTLYPQKLALISPTCGGRSVDIVHLRTKSTEFVCFLSLSGGIPGREPNQVIAMKIRWLRAGFQIANSCGCRKR
jgi:hypothetical protein